MSGIRIFLWSVGALCLLFVGTLWYGLSLTFVDCFGPAAGCETTYRNARNAIFSLTVSGTGGGLVCITSAILHRFFERRAAKN